MKKVTKKIRFACVLLFCNKFLIIGAFQLQWFLSPSNANGTLFMERVVYMHYEMYHPTYCKCCGLIVSFSFFSPFSFFSNGWQFGVIGLLSFNGLWNSFVPLLGLAPGVAVQTVWITDIPVLSECMRKRLLSVFVCFFPPRMLCTVHNNTQQSISRVWIALVWLSWGDPARLTGC